MWRSGRKQESVQKSVAEASMVVNEGGIEGSRLYANITFNGSGDFDLFTVLYEPVIMDRVVMGWKEVSFSLVEVLINDVSDVNASVCVASGAPVFFDNLSLVGDGFYRVVFEFWDRVDVPGESFLVCKEVFFVFPERGCDAEGLDRQQGF